MRGVTIDGMPQVDWPLNYCIHCREPFGDGPDHPHRRTDSHVIPKSLGGNLSTTAICVTCNSRSGTRFEASLPLDPTIRHEMEKFADLISDFEKQQYKDAAGLLATTPPSSG